MRKTRVLHYCSVFLLFNTALLEGQVYYISNNGLNSRNGTSAGSDWKTFDKMNDFELASGLTVYLEAVSFFSPPLIVTSSGTIGNRITYTKYGDGN